MTDVAKQKIWRQIYHSLSREIADGQYPKGQKLPTEAALARRFNVNRHTVRRALAMLQDEGRIHVRQGAGAFVSQSQIDYPLGTKTRFSQNLDGSGLKTARKVLRLETLPATSETAGILNIPTKAPVHIFEAVSQVDGTPFSYSRSIFPADRLPDLPDALRTNESITVALTANGVADYVRTWTHLTAKRATGMIARVLQLSEGAPVLRTVSLNSDINGLPVEYGHTWFHGDRAQLVVKGDAFALET